ncbi:hypothetical protein [Arthrobacter glacialis]|uniref:hypothetical protein n=1 Tax=Arthrobacter glacialis TaxID=1664 RepID=UPI0010575333|nr:hypothetical protein [Arthrobacter glacialis]
MGDHHERGSVRWNTAVLGFEVKNDGGAVTIRTSSESCLPASPELLDIATNVMCTQRPAGTWRHGRLGYFRCGYDVVLWTG